MMKFLRAEIIEPSLSEKSVDSVTMRQEAEFLYGANNMKFPSLRLHPLNKSQHKERRSNLRPGPSDKSKQILLGRKKTLSGDEILFNLPHTERWQTINKVLIEQKTDKK